MAERSTPSIVHVRTLALASGAGGAIFLEGEVAGVSEGGGFGGAAFGGAGLCHPRRALNMAARSRAVFMIHATHTPHELLHSPHRLVD